ncbi:MAG TPA: hypothetical protein VGQ26_02955, partial [Streptosporangiaceae bacterium]|nr:hypothetical protein [Streptosporangiaceae bacterium]
QWNWWQEGREDQEHDRLWTVLEQWDHATPPPGGYRPVDETMARIDAKHAERERERRDRAASYDEDRAMARLRLLRARATAGFMRNVHRAPADPAQQAKAEELLMASRQEATALAETVGDPETVVDRAGDLPAVRRDRHLRDHMRYFRHPTLREWSSGQRLRFNRLLAMPPPKPDGMCSECQAPAEWHTYALSLRLWAGTSELGSRAAQTAALLPGWWDRCPACTDYQLHHQWGHNALPGFDGMQWQEMLPPLLRAIFSPDKPSRRKPVDRRAALTRRLRSAEAEVQRLRQQLAEAEASEGEP